jgi:translation initiation factor IF-1
MRRIGAVSSILSARGRRILLSSLVCAASIATVGVQAAELTFNLRIENGRVPEKMRLVRVVQGDIVRLQWSVDRPVTLHLHGYDIERRFEPGTAGEMTFTARATGRFPVHAHAAGERTSDHVHEETPLLYVEVYPR